MERWRERGRWRDDEIESHSWNTASALRSFYYVSRSPFRRFSQRTVSNIEFCLSRTALSCETNPPPENDIQRTSLHKKVACTEESTNIYCEEYHTVEYKKKW